MAQRVTLPKDIRSFLKGDAEAQLRKMESMLNALANLKIDVLLPTGQQLSGTIQFGGDTATVMVRANAGGVNPSTMQLTLCDGTVINVLLAPKG